MKTKETKSSNAVKNNNSFFAPKNSGGFFVQPKLNVGQPGDKYEQEADRVADQVMTKRDVAKPFFPAATPIIQNRNIAETITPLIQRAEEEEVQAKPVQLAEEEEVQAKLEIQRQEEEEEMMQMQPMEEEEEMLQTQAMEEEEPVQLKMERETEQIQGIAKSGFKGSSSSYPFYNRIQASFGNHDISNIQAFTNTDAIIATQKMGAHAYASGNKVAFRNAPSLHIAAHEAAHVVQQRNGVSLKQGIGKKNDAYEQHADMVADSVVQGKGTESLLSKLPKSGSQIPNAIQQLKVSSTGSKLGEYWDMHVYPGHHPGADSGLRDVGRQVRSFQRLKNRSINEEGGQRIVNVSDKGITSGKRLIDSQEISQTNSGGPKCWNIDLTTHELFDPQPEVTDVIQYGIGDCYLLATLQSMCTTPGGKAQLVNAVNESGNGYVVEFFRPQVIGSQVLIDPNSRIRVTLGRRHNPRGVRFNENTESMSDADARELVRNSKYGAQLQATDTFDVWWTKRVVWPWAIERAYASVAGGFNRIEGGFASLPMMVLTGEIPFMVYDFSTLSVVQLGLLLELLHLISDNDTVITSATFSNLDAVCSSSFLIHSTSSDDGVRFKGDDGVVTPWIPWYEIDDFITNIIVLDSHAPFNGGSFITIMNKPEDPEQTIMNASSRPGVSISGMFRTVRVGQGLILVPGHAYSVTALSTAGAQTTNPWSKLHPGLIPPVKLKRAFSRLVVKL